MDKKAPITGTVIIISTLVKYHFALVQIHWMKVLNCRAALVLLLPLSRRFGLAQQGGVTWPGLAPPAWLGPLSLLSVNRFHSRFRVSVSGKYRDFETQTDCWHDSLLGNTLLTRSKGGRITSRLFYSPPPPRPPPSPR